MAATAPVSFSDPSSALAAFYNTPGLFNTQAQAQALLTANPNIFSGVTTQNYTPTVADYSSLAANSGVDENSFTSTPISLYGLSLNPSYSMVSPQSGSVYAPTGYATGEFSTTSTFSPQEQVTNQSLLTDVDGYGYVTPTSNINQSIAGQIATTQATDAAQSEQNVAITGKQNQLYTNYLTNLETPSNMSDPLLTALEIGGSLFGPGIAGDIASGASLGTTVGGAALDAGTIASGTYEYADEAGDVGASLGGTTAGLGTGAASGGADPFGLGASYGIPGTTGGGAAADFSIGPSTVGGGGSVADSIFTPAGGVGSDIGSTDPYNIFQTTQPFSTSLTGGTPVAGMSPTQLANAIDSGTVDANAVTPSQLAAAEQVGAPTAASTPSTLMSSLQKILGLGGGNVAGTSNPLLGANPLMNLISGVYSLNQASNPNTPLGTAAATQANPAAAMYPQYQAQLQALMANPGSITSMPGYQSGLEAVERTQAAQGYTGSGNAMNALANYGGNFYNQQLQTLMQLSGENSQNTGAAAQSVIAGSNSTASQRNAALAGIGEGVAGLGYEFGGDIMDFLGL